MSTSQSTLVSPNLVEERKLIWHPAELPGGVGCARQRVLFSDEYSGRASLLFQFDTSWRRGTGFHHSDLEVYVLNGGIRLGEKDLFPGSYASLPAGAALQPIDVIPSTRILAFRAGEWAFDESDWDQPWAKRKLEIVLKPNFQKADQPGADEPNLYRSVLRDDDGDGFRTEVVKFSGMRTGSKVHFPEDVFDAYLTDGVVIHNGSEHRSPVAFTTESDQSTPEIFASTEESSWLIRVPRG